MNPNNYCVIMAGGIGSRFWPMSKTVFPKQFHDILGVGKTLLQQTHDRFLPLCPPENILVVTNDRYKSLVLEQLPTMQPSQVLCEPFMRNTAPCVAYASHWIMDKNPEANIVVAPSDHLILNEVEFIKTIEMSFEQAQNGDLVTLGIKPTRPDTGYGYIQWEDDKTVVHERIKKVKTFTEKPDLELAKDFIASGDFSWNSGIFIWKVSSIVEAFQKYLPEMDKAFSEGKGKYGTSDEKPFVNEMYSACENISIDYGIMEKAKNVKVVLSDFGWSDLGTWGSLHGHLQHDDHRNGVVGKHVLTYNCSNTLVRVPNEKLVVLQGLNGYIVVDSGNTLLVCKMEDEQKIKSFVNDIKINKGEDWV